MAHWLYILAGLGSGSLGYALWYYGWRAFFLLRGLRADDEQRRWWFEAARLMRKDAKDLPSYLPDKREDGARPVPSHASGDDSAGNDVAQHTLTTDVR